MVRISTDYTHTHTHGPTLDSRGDRSITMGAGARVSRSFDSAVAAAFDAFVRFELAYGHYHT